MRSHTSAGARCDAGSLAKWIYAYVYEQRERQSGQHGGKNARVCPVYKDFVCLGSQGLFLPRRENLIKEIRRSDLRRLQLQ